MCFIKDVIEFYAIKYISKRVYSKYNGIKMWMSEYTAKCLNIIEVLKWKLKDPMASNERKYTIASIGIIKE